MLTIAAIRTIITRARQAMIRRHSRIFDFERDVMGPHRATWSRDVVVGHVQDYADYLNTDHWQALTRKKRQAAGYKCEQCGCDDERLDTHHLTYERIGRERMEDLIVLCESCHREEHDIDTQKGN